MKMLGSIPLIPQCECQQSSIHQRSQEYLLQSLNEVNSSLQYWSLVFCWCFQLQSALLWVWNSWHGRDLNWCFRSNDFQYNLYQLKAERLRECKRCHPNSTVVICYIVVSNGSYCLVAEIFGGLYYLKLLRHYGYWICCAAHLH